MQTLLVLQYIIRNPRKVFPSIVRIILSTQLSQSKYEIFWVIELHHGDVLTNTRYVDQIAMADIRDYAIAAMIGG